MEISEEYKKVLETGTWIEIHMVLQELSRIQVISFCDDKK